MPNVVEMTTISETGGENKIRWNPMTLDIGNVAMILTNLCPRQSLEITIVFSRSQLQRSTLELLIRSQRVLPGNVG
jgi:hypothetical protein